MEAERRRDELQKKLEEEARPRREAKARKKAEAEEAKRKEQEQQQLARQARQRRPSRFEVRTEVKSPAIIAKGIKIVGQGQYCRILSATRRTFALSVF